MSGLHPLTLAQRESLARELAADPDNFVHIVKFSRHEGWTLQHPLTERNESLFECELHEWCMDLKGPPVAPGIYVATQNEDGEWRFDERR